MAQFHIEGTEHYAAVDSDFAKWLRKYRVKQPMIDKITDQYQSVDELKIIPNEDVDNVANDLQLNTLEKYKFKYIVDKAKLENEAYMVPQVVVNDIEQQAIISMQKKIQEISKSIKDIDKEQKGIDAVLYNSTKQIETAFNDLEYTLKTRKSLILSQLKQITNDRKKKLNAYNKRLNQQFASSKKTLSDCHGLLRKPIEFQGINSRKQKILQLSKHVKNVTVTNISSDAYKVNVLINKDELINSINKFVQISTDHEPNKSENKEDNDDDVGDDIDDDNKQQDVITYQWKWKDESGRFRLYKPDISDKLNELNINESMLFRSSKFIPFIENNKLNYDSFEKTNPYSITKLSDNTANQMNLNNQYIREVRRFVLKKQNEATTTMDTVMFTLPNSEYYSNKVVRLSDDEIKQLFYKTASKNYQILQIESVVPQEQDIQYEVQLWKKCDQLKRNRAEIEKYLWHASNYDVIQLVIQNGFDRSYSTTAAYGNGTYFARDASYGVTGYCPTHSDGYQYMLLCKVIVGDSIQGSSSMQRVPKKADQTEYDTLVDTPNNPSIYVLWRDYRAVPMYQIKFKRL